MTAKEHEAAASREDRAATATVSWTSEQNLTESSYAQAEHRQIANKHRAASKKLRDAENLSCTGISDEDRDTSPFTHRQDIIGAQGVLKESSAVDGGKVVQVQQIDREVLGYGGLQGARVTFQAVPGMTREWLQRVVDCHLAQNAVIGSDPSMSYCPLAVPHASAKVISTDNGFAIDITSKDAESAKEIVKRASALGPGGPYILK